MNANLVFNGESMDSLEEAKSQLIAPQELMREYNSGHLKAWLYDNAYDDELSKLNGIAEEKGDAISPEDIADAMGLTLKSEEEREDIAAEEKMEADAAVDQSGIGALLSLLERIANLLLEDDNPENISLAYQLAPNILSFNRAYYEEMLQEDEFEKLAELMVRVSLRVGAKYMEGEDEQKDEKLGYDFFSHAYSWKPDSAEAVSRLVLCQLTGSGCTKSKPQACKTAKKLLLMKKNANDDNATIAVVLNAVGDIYDAGQKGVKKDEKMSFRFYECANKYDGNNPVVQTDYGIALLSGT